jgi:hypothetical protein
MMGVDWKSFDGRTWILGVVEKTLNFYLAIPLWWEVSHF